MVFKEKEEIVTDRAWGQLYDRLSQDGLLPSEKTVTSSSGRTVSLRIRWVAAVVVLLLGFISGWYIMHYTDDVPAKDMVVLYNEANAPTLATMLEDGSVVYLSDNSSLRYPDRFAADCREVVLIGEAFFDVYGQKTRPFFIDTEPAVIEVVGTSFTVKSETPASFSLSVREGEVKVALKKNEQTVYVKAGETVQFRSERLQVVQADMPFDNYFKRIHFKDERLGDVVQIINKHAQDVRVEVEPELEERLLTVTFSGNAPAIVEKICLALNLQHLQQDNIIYISRSE